MDVKCALVGREMQLWGFQLFPLAYNSNSVQSMWVEMLRFSTAHTDVLWPRDFFLGVLGEPNPSVSVSLHLLHPHIHPPKILMTVLHYSPKVFIFSNQPESSNLSSVSLYPDRTSPPTPPSSLSLMGTGHRTHEKGVRVFFPATE